MRAAAVVVFTAVLAIAPACTDRALDPSYPTAIVSADAGLAGLWREEARGDAGRRLTSLTIRAERVAVRDGRLQPSTAAEHAAETVEAYSIALEAEADPPVSITLNAYRLSINGRDYLAGQLGFGELSKAGAFPFVLPLHFVVRVEREGDVLRLWGNEPAIAWLPAAAPLDPPGELDGPPPLPAKGEDAHHIVVITTSIDRIIELLRRPNADQLFCGEPGVLRRVQP